MLTANESYWLLTDEGERRGCGKDGLPRCGAGALDEEPWCGDRRGEGYDLWPRCDLGAADERATLMLKRCSGQTRYGGAKRPKEVDEAGSPAWSELRCSAQGSSSRLVGRGGLGGWRIRRERGDERIHEIAWWPIFSCAGSIGSVERCPKFGSIWHLD